MVSRYKELDALRGIAAIVVVFFHFTMWQEVSKLGFKLGVTGVDLFFMISGFVIFMTINKVSSVLEFSINRVCRLYPTLIHQHISIKVIIPSLMGYAHFNFWPSAFIALCTVLLLATLVTYFIEIPFGKKANNLLRRVFKLPKRAES